MPCIYISLYLCNKLGEMFQWHLRFKMKSTIRSCYQDAWRLYDFYIYIKFLLETINRNLWGRIWPCQLKVKKYTSNCFFLGATEIFFSSGVFTCFLFLSSFLANSLFFRLSSNSEIKSGQSKFSSGSQVLSSLKKL